MWNSRTVMGLGDIAEKYTRQIGVLEKYLNSTESRIIKLGMFPDLAYSVISELLREWKLLSKCKLRLAGRRLRAEQRVMMISFPGASPPGLTPAGGVVQCLTLSK